MRAAREGFLLSDVLCMSFLLEFPPAAGSETRAGPYVSGRFGWNDPRGQQGVHSCVNGVYTPASCGPSAGERHGMERARLA